MRARGVIPTNGGKGIGEGDVQIIWASCHIVTVLGWLIASVLFWMASSPEAVQDRSLILSAVASAMRISSLLVLIATEGRHPGWTGLLGVAVVVWYGNGAWRTSTSDASLLAQADPLRQAALPTIEDGNDANMCWDCGMSMARALVVPRADCGRGNKWGGAVSVHARHTYS